MAAPAGQARLFLDKTGSKAYDFGCPRIQAGDDPFPSGTCNTTGAVEDAGTFNGYTYAGCYTDAGQVRAMPFQAFVGNNNNAATCTAACRAAGYSMAGTEYGDGKFQRISIASPMLTSERVLLRQFHDCWHPRALARDGLHDELSRQHHRDMRRCITSFCLRHWQCHHCRRSCITSRCRTVYIPRMLYRRCRTSPSRIFLHYQRYDCREVCIFLWQCWYECIRCGIYE